MPVNHAPDEQLPTLSVNHTGDRPRRVLQGVELDESYVCTPAAARLRRAEPTLPVVARYWWERGDMFPMDAADYATPHCFACCLIVPRRAYAMTDTVSVRWDRASRWLDRAHLADRCRGGLDGPQNLVPLCLACHHRMPSFGSGWDALAWALGGGGRSRSASRGEITMRGSVPWRHAGWSSPYDPGDPGRPACSVMGSRQSRDLKTARPSSCSVRRRDHEMVGGRDMPIAWRNRIFAARSRLDSPCGEHCQQVSRRNSVIPETPVWY